MNSFRILGWNGEEYRETEEKGQGKRRADSGVQVGQSALCARTFDNKPDCMLKEDFFDFNSPMKCFAKDLRFFTEVANSEGLRRR
jgi:hypothetical protein